MDQIQNKNQTFNKSINMKFIHLVIQIKSKSNIIKLRKTNK
jgi:hypothetical protein